MYLRRIAAALVAPLALAPLASGAARADQPQRAAASHITRTKLDRLDTSQPGLSTNGCRHNDASSWVSGVVGVGVAGPVVAKAEHALDDRWRATLTYRSGGKVRARVPVSGSYLGRWDGMRHAVQLEIDCSDYTRLTHAGFGSRVETATFRVTGLTATIDGETYHLGQGAAVRQQVRRMSRAAVTGYHRAGRMVTFTGVVQRWTKVGKAYRWRATRGTVGLQTSCRHREVWRRTGPRGGFRLTAPMSAFRDDSGSHRVPTLGTETRTTPTTSGTYDGWFWQPRKHRIADNAWGIFCEDD